MANLRSLRCVSLSLFLLSFLLPYEAAAKISDRDYTTWRLRPPTWTNSDLREGAYRVDEVQADARGGFVRITFIGTEGCQGQVQRFKYTWRFDKDISVLSGKRGRISATPPRTCTPKASPVSGKRKPTI